MVPSKDLTPELNEQWRKAVMQVVIADGAEDQEFSAELHREHWIAESTLLALMPETEQSACIASRLQHSTKYLTDWGVPGWAIELRSNCIAREWEAKEAWVSEFALRSVVALIGLQLRYPTQENRVDVYRRLLLGFFHKALEPFVEWVETSDTGKHWSLYGEDWVNSENDERRRIYCELVDLYDFIDELDFLPSPEEWQSKQRTITHRNPRIRRNMEEEGGREGFVMCARLVRIAEIVLFDEPDMWWSTTGTDLAELFFEMHQWPNKWEAGHGPRSLMDTNSSLRPRDRHVEEEPVHAEPVATAYLAALEAECPPPGWLPLE
ncbi:MAG: hypothetical protein QM758_20680 [Armatimonas sp.]